MRNSEQTKTRQKHRGDENEAVREKSEISGKKSRNGNKNTGGGKVTVAGLPFFLFVGTL